MSTNIGLLEEPPGPKPPDLYLSPIRVLAPLLILVFLAEMVAMLILYFIELPNYVLSTLLDGTIMMVLILPGLYYMQIKPLLKEIKERTQAEEEVRASDALLRKVLDLLPVGVRITDEKGRAVNVNRTGQSLWEGTRLVGTDHTGMYKAWFAHSHKPMEAKDWAGAKAICYGETTLNQEIEIEFFDGQQKTILNSAVPIFGPQNVIQGAIIVNQDITRLRQEERALIRTNELLERFFFSIDTNIAYMDRDFNFIRVNDRYAWSGGHTPEFYVGKNHFDLYPHAENQAIFQKVVDTGEPFSVLEKPFEYAEFPERGVTYWDWSLQPVKGVDGAIEGVVLSLVDVTERKRAENRLERQNQELLQVSAAEHKQRVLAEGLVKASISLNRSLELDRVLSSILEQIRKIIPFRGADIVFIEGKTLRVAGFLGFESYPESQLTLGKIDTLADFPIFQRVCESFEPVVIDSVRQHPLWKVSPGMEWVCSYVGVPLIVGSEVIGLINLTSELTGAFPQEAFDQLQAFAAPAALALYNARLFAAESTARQAAETLSAAAQAFTHSLDLEQVVQLLLDHIHEAVPSDVSNVALLKDETSLSMVAARGYGRWENVDEIPGLPAGGIPDSVIQRMKQARKSLVIPGILSDPLLTGPDSNANIKTWLVAPIIASDKVIGIVGLGKTVDVGFSQKQAELAEAIVGLAAVAIQNAWLFEQVRSSSERLQSLARKLVEVQETERYHIARELHDEAGQALSSLKITLGRLEQDRECPPHLREQLMSLKGVADGVLEELHRLAMDLRPAALDHLGLVAALQQYASSLNSERLSVQFKAVNFEGVRLHSDLETSLYRIVQEALTNVIRHAQARSVGILLQREVGRVILFVEDDGVGFNPGQIERRNRLGLVGMRERAEMVGGNLTIESSPERGTSIIVEVPDDNTYPHRG